MTGFGKNIIIFLVAMALVGMGLYTYIQKSQPFNAASLEHATYLYDQRVAIPEFNLIDHNQQVFTSEDIRDQWTLWFFGFTHCPDICPQTLGLLSAVLNNIKTKHNIDDVSIVFVSVDPTRDTPENLKEYVSSFGENVIGATTNQASLDKFLQNLGIIAVKTNSDSAPDQYTFDHSSSIYLISPDTAISALFNTPHTVSSISNDLAKIINSF